MNENIFFMSTDKSVNYEKTDRTTWLSGNGGQNTALAHVKDINF